jgi:hypothetical protein
MIDSKCGALRLDLQSLVTVPSGESMLDQVAASQCAEEKENGGSHHAYVHRPHVLYSKQ